MNQKKLTSLLNSTKMTKGHTGLLLKRTARNKSRYFGKRVQGTWIRNGMLDQGSENG